MSINIIVAIDDNLSIGKDGSIPWKQSEDLKNFKKLTLGHYVIVGRKTWESLPQKKLPKRTLLVVTRNPDKYKHLQTSDLIFVKSVESAISLTSKDMKKDVWIAGGENVYKAGLKVADFLYITKINTKVEKADSKFPSFDTRDWNLLKKSQYYKSDQDNNHDYYFLIYSKK